jgi:hypothetical protein
MSEWRQQFNFDPISGLVNSGEKTVSHFAKRDLLEEHVEPINTLWQLPEASKIINKQNSDGSWKYHGGKIDIRSQRNYNQLETLRILGLLIGLYGFTREHEAVRNAAYFLFSFQTSEGDFRGIYGDQYTPNYSAAIMELLTKAGYHEDPRIEKGIKWLLKMRQDDGGWAIPMRTLSSKDSLTLIQAMKRKTPVEPDRSKPFSHLVTGVVLRAFAAHPKYRGASAAKHAGELLKSRFFQPDKYPDRKAPSFWTSFAYPFWFTDLLSSLDSLSLLGFTRQDPNIDKALKWFVNRQQKDGLWTLRMLKTGRTNLNLWIDLAICRVFKRFHENSS